MVIIYSKQVTKTLMWLIEINENHYIVYTVWGLRNSGNSNTRTHGIVSREVIFTTKIFHYMPDTLCFAKSTWSCLYADNDL